MLKDYNKRDELTREQLASDPDFIADASYFLRERDGETLLTTDEVYDKFMEHMRYQNVNEITALRDLEYAQNSDLQGKQNFARLIDAYDKVNEDFSGRMMMDYAQGIATAPSTYLGLITGGTGKAAAVAGTQAAKIGVRKALSSVFKSAVGLPSAVKAAAVEGAIGTGQALAQEETRVQTGLQEDIRGEQVALTGGLSALTGGIMGGIAGKAQSKQGKAADELYEQSQIAAANRANEASEKSQEVLKTASPDKIKEVKEVLNELDPTKVAVGRRLKRDLLPGDTMEAALGSEVTENITAAAIRIKDEIDLNPGERITEGISRLIREGKMDDITEVRQILKEHNLTPDQFSLVYYAEMSEAGRKLGQAGQVRKALGGRPVKNVVDRVIDDIDELQGAGLSPITGKEAEDIVKNRKAFQYVKDLDSLRLGLMTSQLATTMRNNINGGFRIGIDATTRAIDNMINFRNPFDGTFDVAKFAMNPYEARVIRQVYAEEFPEDAARLFREAADLASLTGSETALATIGRKANFLNTASDNYFKQAVLSASLKRRLADKGQNLYDIIRKGEFKDIDDDILKGAVDDALEFTYQSSFKGDDAFSKKTRGFLQLHRDAPFVVSMFMPFPRFIANQLKFTYEHAPLIGLLPLDRIGSKLPTRTTKEYFKDKAPKQVTGAMMLGAAYAWRLKQGETNNWYEFKTNDGKVVDGRPVYGPFSPFMLAADLIYRYKNGTMPTSIKTYVRDSMQALLGSTFRTGMGIYALDQLYQDLDSGKSAKAVGETIGNILNTFTIPASVVRDFYGPTDPRNRIVPETREGDYGVDFFDIVGNTAVARAGRSLPPFLSDETARPARSPFQTGPLMSINPIEKQLFGLAKREQKNTLQQEMARLNMQPFELYRRQPNQELDMYMRQELSREDGVLNLSDRMAKIIRSPEYRKKSVEGRRIALKDAVRDVINQAKERATVRIEREADMKDLPYTSVDVTSWERTDPLKKAEVEREYQEKYGGDSVSSDKDRTIAIRGKDMNVLQWALERASQLGGM